MKNSHRQAIDPHVTKIAIIGVEDPAYAVMVQYFREKTPINSVKADIDLKKIEGQCNSLSLYKTD